MAVPADSRRWKMLYLCVELAVENVQKGQWNMFRQLSCQGLNMFSGTFRGISSPCAPAEARQWNVLGLFCAKKISGKTGIGGGQISENAN